MSAGPTLALAQPPAGLEGVQARLGWLAHEVPKARASGADLLLLPELFATGYNIGAAAAAERAEPADGPTSARIAALARQHRIAICWGFVERDGERLRNAAQLVGPDGARLALHRKLVLPPGWEGAAFTPAEAPGPVVRLGGVSVGLLICFDVEFPETVRALARAGADLVLVPTALETGWDWVADTLVPARAWENALFLAYCNAAGEEHGMVHAGRSVILAPDGAEIARAGDRPRTLLARIDPARAAAARERLGYLEHAARLRAAGL